MSVTPGWFIYFFLFGFPDTKLVLFLVNVGFLLSGLLGDLTSFKDSGNLCVSPASDEILAQCFLAPICCCSMLTCVTQVYLVLCKCSSRRVVKETGC